MFNLSFFSFVGHELLHCCRAETAFIVSCFLFLAQALFRLLSFELCRTATYKRKVRKKKNLPFIKCVFIKVHSLLFVDLRAVYKSR